MITGRQSSIAMSMRSATSQVVAARCASCVQSDFGKLQASSPSPIRRTAASLPNRRGFESSSISLVPQKKERVGTAADALLEELVWLGVRRRAVQLPSLVDRHALRT